MPHETPLIATITVGLGIAFLLGLLAHRIKLSPLVGYLLAGVAVGPFTPGFMADQKLALELAEIGVILLMFGVGLHFSLKDLLSVRAVAIPGAVGQMAVTTTLGFLLSRTFGWSPGAGFVFGLSLSVASTVVLLRVLQGRRIVQTERGRIAMGWLIVEDLVMVLALVLLPVMAKALDGSGQSAGQVGLAVATTLGKVGAFVLFMLLIGKRVIPFVLHYVAHTGSRELFRLAVLAIAMGVAFGAAALFGVSFALGAFFAGMVLSESELSQRAAEETLPLRDAFAVLFFVSVGMLFNPMVVLTQPLALLATVAIILIGKFTVSLTILYLTGRRGETAFTVAGSLAQIGEFSFILAGLGVSLGLLPKAGRDLILAAAIVSIVVNPLMINLALRLSGKPGPAKGKTSELAITSLTLHTVLVGFGRVGETVAAGLQAAGLPVLVIENSDDALGKARAAGFETLTGNAADPAILRQANLGAAIRLIVAIPNAFEAGQIVEQAHRANSALAVMARAHSEQEVAHLTALGANIAILGEHELARGILDRAVGPLKPAP
jgi:CPA2 family monovalent cation:H+ antiporter-2